MQKIIVQDGWIHIMVFRQRKGVISARSMDIAQADWYREYFMKWYDRTQWRVLEGKKYKVFVIDLKTLITSNDMALKVVTHYIQTVGITGESTN